MRRIGAFAIVYLLVVFAGTALAQTATTTLRGIVKDPTGAAVPGATLTLTNHAQGQVLKTVSRPSGEYQLDQVPPATYMISVTAPGFGTTEKLAELLVGQPATVNFVLSVQGSTETINVSEAAQTLNTTDAQLGGSADNELIQALPSETRNVPDLLSLQPGVLYLPQDNTSRTGAVNGGRSDQGNITLDGVDDNDQVHGYAFTGVLRETQDSVEEFRVTTSNADADAGRSSGAQVSLLTKSGTNSFHGAAYEYFRPSNTVSNQYFNKQAQLESGLPNRPPKLIRNIFGADLGGPIFKDKLFFFGNYEGQRQAENQTVTRTTSTSLYDQGVLQYTSGGATEQLSAAQVTALDALNGCSVCGTAAYPSGPGPDPDALAYFRSEPAANGTTTGDGLNSGSYTFASPAPVSLNTMIARIDYEPSVKHRIFVRGNLQKDTSSEVEQFPGQGPSSTTISNNKGITAGDTWTITPNLINDIRYGYVRAGEGITGIGQGDYVDFRFLSTATAETRNTVTSVPVNNIIDNFNITKGKHNIEIGVNWRLVHQNRTSDATSFNSASSNPYWLAGNAPSPQSLGGNVAPLDGGFQNSYNIAYSNLVGTIPSVTDIYNYDATSINSGVLLPDGATIVRHFSSNEYEGFVQDSWRPLPNLTVTAGVRYSLLQTPSETRGQEVTPFVQAATPGTPNVDTHAWYLQREAAALKGEIYEPNLSFAPAGRFYNRPGFYPENKNNIAPRLAIAYAPDSKTSIRAGAGIYYDHFGEGLVNIFSQQGEFGLAESVTNPAGIYSDANSPRYTGRHALPFNNGAVASTLTYPNLAPTNSNQGFAITWGLDSKIQTPYSTAYDLSIQHQFPAGFTLDLAYVGRYGTHLLQSLDLAEPVDYTDPQGGGDYYTAGTELSRIVDQNADNANATVQPIQYFEDVFPYMAGQAGPGTSATQSIYTLEWAPFRDAAGETTSLADIDFYCASIGYCSAGHQSRFWQDQFSSLYALSSIGKSSYNAVQWTLRHPTSHGLTLDVSYTLSKSIDWGSDAERDNEFTAKQFSNSEILNTWKPYLNKAVSDFDTTSLLTVDWVYQLPMGKGKVFLGTAGRLTQAVFGNWQWSGIGRATSGLPWDVIAPGWSTNWQIESFGVVTDPTLHAQKHFDATGNPKYFAHPNQINAGIYTGGPIRLPYPGEAGQRNNFRGDGYIDVDSGVTKSWALGRFGDMVFAWEVYNVTNTNRFDPLTIQSQLAGGTLGTASGLLGGNNAPRRMQFSLRYNF